MLWFDKLVSGETVQRRVNGGTRVSAVRDIGSTHKPAPSHGCTFILTLFRRMLLHVVEEFSIGNAGLLRLIYANGVF